MIGGRDLYKRFTNRLRDKVIQLNVVETVYKKIQICHINKIKTALANFKSDKLFEKAACTREDFP